MIVSRPVHKNRTPVAAMAATGSITKKTLGLLLNHHDRRGCVSPDSVDPDDIGA